MRFRSLMIPLLFLALPVSGLAKDVLLPIAGSVGIFRTDTRILNPSFEKDITVAATFYPGKGFEADGTVEPAGPPVQKTITIPKRQMARFDDIVVTLFQTSGLGGIRLSSQDEFIATQRIYAMTEDGTLGQFVSGEDVADARVRGVLVQLKSNGTPGMKDTFRTNVGFLNPNATDATVTFRLYDEANAVTGQSVVVVLQPHAVMTPSPVDSIFGNPSVDLSDSWIAFESDQPIFAYGSVVDNGTTDPTFVRSFDDVPSPAVDDPPASQTVIVGPGMTFTPPSMTVREGDTVTWEFRALHTTTSDARSGPEVWDSGTMSTGTFSHTFSAAGTYPYYCSIHSVPGGTAMNGVITVVTRSGQPPGY